ncbi:MAG TPA: serine/threonine-protein kinase [Kofleriaceae bacterium]
MLRDLETRDLSPTNVDESSTQLVEIDDAPLVADAERYKSVEQLGKGGMGEIQLCKDSRIARHVAVKMLRGELRDNPDYRARFLREVRLQGQLEHPAIVPVHDLGMTPDGDLYFTMKRVRGVTLEEALRAMARGDRTRFSRRRLLTAFSSVCLAVDFAHSRGVVHRDLKPSNVMLGDFGEVYVLDWGIAKVMHRGETPLPEQSIEVPDMDTPTRAGAVLGTPRYMAPEQKRGEADPRSDGFSLGLILEEILGCDGEPVPELAAVSARATAADPADRFASVRELQVAIERFLDGDRDLEVRRRLADEHAHRAEQALERAQNDSTQAARTEAARDVGRALGMEPGHARALRALARLLSDVPAHLPPAAQVAFDQYWRDRALRMLKSGVLAMLALFALVPFFIHLGVRDWPSVVAFMGLLGGAFAFHRLAGDGLYVWQRGVMFVLLMASLVVLSRSMGLLGMLPIALTIVLIAYRINVPTRLLGTAIFAGGLLTLLTPFVLEWLDVIEPAHMFADGRITIMPRLHELPAMPTQFYLIICCAGALAIGQFYAHQFVRELLRAEERVIFHAWQLEQLLPPEEQRTLA